MEIFIYIIIGAVIGALVSWLFVKAKTTAVVQAEKDSARENYNALDRMFIELKSSTDSETKRMGQELVNKDSKLQALREELKSNQKQLSDARDELATVKAKNSALADSLKAISGIRKPPNAWEHGILTLLGSKLT